jgi:serine/threonine protein kinase
MAICPSCRKPVDSRLSRCPWDGTLLGTVMRDPLLGTYLGGRYLLRKCIAERGRARIYTAEEAGNARQLVATVHPMERLDEARVARFRELVEKARGIEHGACTTIRDFGHTGDSMLFVVEEGEVWHQLTQELVIKGRLPFSAAVDLAIQLVGGLDYLHDKGLHHRSLSPASLRLTFDAQGALKLQIPVAEIVLRSVAPEEDAEAKPYLPPEGTSPADADLHVAALILVEMLTGDAPAVALAGELDWNKINVEPEILAGLREIVERALGQTGDRFGTAWEMRRELEALTGRSRLGRYSLLHRIAVGGMGEIYLARAEGIEGIDINRFCVIKTIRTNLVQSGEFVERFLAEARVLASLSHGNIVPVHDVGKVGSVFYIAMEYVAGKDMRKVLNAAAKAQRRMPVPLALFIAKELANGLAYAHRAKVQGLWGLVHRDVSPHNTLVSYEGEVKLIDFGLAKGVQELAKATQEGVVMGKVCYLSPEQARAEALDQRTDIYSAGLVLFEMLTGEPFFNQPTIEEVLTHVANPIPQSPSARNPEVPPEVDRICLRAIAPRREERYLTAGALRDDLTAELARLAPRTNPEEVGAFVRELFPSARQEEESLLSDLSMTMPPVKVAQSMVAQAAATATTLPEEASNSEALSLLGRTPTPIHLASTLLPGAAPAIPPPLTLAVAPGVPATGVHDVPYTSSEPTVQTTPRAELQYRPRSRLPLLIAAAASIAGAGLFFGLRWSQRRHNEATAERAAFKALAAWKVGQQRVADAAIIDPADAGPEVADEPDAGAPRPKSKLRLSVGAAGTPSSKKKARPTCKLVFDGAAGMQVIVDGVPRGRLPFARSLAVSADEPHLVVVTRANAEAYRQRLKCPAGEGLLIKLGTISE